MTTSYKVKVNHEVLRWAREKFSGYSIPGVVNKIKLKTVSDQTIISWENGELDPSYAQIKKLSKIYKTPLAVFFLPAPPEGLEPNKELRTLPPNYSDNIPPEINFIIRKGMARVSDIAELSGGQVNEVNTLRSKLRDIKLEGTKKENAIKCSKIVREILGVSVADCNSFAGEFLVPNEDFISIDNIRSISTDNISDVFINELADKYKISREVILRKLKDNKFIIQEVYENKNKEWEKERKSKDKNIGKKKGGGDYYSTQAVYLGNKYLNLAFSNYYGGRIDECQLSDFLEIKVRNLQGIEDHFIRSQK